MVVLDVDHPDIEKFIWCKALEEEKAEALKNADFDMRLDSDAFTSVQFQNANNSSGSPTSSCRRSPMTATGTSSPAPTAA